MPVTNAPINPPCCVNCDSTEVTDDDFCHGCKRFICDRCSNITPPFGGHDWIDHVMCPECGSEFCEGFECLADDDEEEWDD